MNPVIEWLQKMGIDPARFDQQALNSTIVAAGNRDPYETALDIARTLGGQSAAPQSGGGGFGLSPEDEQIALLMEAGFPYEAAVQRVQGGGGPGFLTPEDFMTLGLSPEQARQAAMASGLSAAGLSVAERSALGIGGIGGGGGGGGGAAPAPVHWQTVQDERTGEVVLYNPVTQEFRRSGQQLGFAGIDPRELGAEEARIAGNQDELVRANLAEQALQNRATFAEEGILSRAEMQESARQADNAARLRAFEARAQNLPAFGQLGIDVADQTRQILSSGADYLSRAFGQSGQPNPLGHISPADQINELLAMQDRMEGEFNRDYAPTGVTNIPSLTPMGAFQGPNLVGFQGFSDAPVVQPRNSGGGGAAAGGGGGGGFGGGAGFAPVGPSKNFVTQFPGDPKVAPARPYQQWGNRSGQTAYTNPGLDDSAGAPRGNQPGTSLNPYSGGTSEGWEFNPFDIFPSQSEQERNTQQLMELQARRRRGGAPPQGGNFSYQDTFSGWGDLFQGIGDTLGFANGTLDPDKARMMLDEGMANGMPLTEDQMRYFGMIAGHEQGTAPGFTRAPMFVAGEPAPGRIGDTGELLINPTEAPIAVVSNKNLPKDMNVVGFANGTIFDPEYQDNLASATNGPDWNNQQSIAHFMDRFGIQNLENTDTTDYYGRSGNTFTTANPNVAGRASVGNIGREQQPSFGPVDEGGPMRVSNEQLRQMALKNMPPRVRQVYAGQQATPGDVTFGMPVGFRAPTFRQLAGLDEQEMGAFGTAINAISEGKAALPDFIRRAQMSAAPVGAGFRPVNLIGGRF